MLRKSTKKLISAALLFNTLCFGVLYCDGDGGGESSISKEENAACETGCVEDYLSELPECQEDSLECLADCSSPDDDECVWECDGKSKCYRHFLGCLGVCPCVDKMEECGMDCFDDDDDNDENDDDEENDCVIDCTEQYTDCAGPNSPYFDSIFCEDSCQHTCGWDDMGEVVEMDVYLACIQDCNEDKIKCLEDIL